MAISMKKQFGFTVIELLVIVVILVTASVLFFVQKNNIAVAGRDDHRKTAINAMYYSLEEYYFAENKHYPEFIDEKVLPTVDPDLFTDPNGHKIGKGESEYRYEPVACENGECSGYSLRALLENESDFVKTNRS